MHKPTEFYTVLRWFPAFPVLAQTGEILRSFPAGWGQVTDDLCTEAEAWGAYLDGFHNEPAPTRANSMVVKIDLAEGTSRDLSEEWASAYAAEFPASEVSADDYADDYADWKYQQRRDDRMVGELA